MPDRPVQREERTYREQGLVVIGVAAGERGNYREQVLGVRALVKQKDDQIHYTIGIDTNKTMVRPWLEASGRTGLPTAFIVDHTGRIAWAASGAPMLGLEAAIQDAISSARRSAAAPARP
ncbi:hypothetical protein J4558_24200 [Leptolyngbya sp. 15MV]|nr:hypothetical protein J4558_24200 [Leptolyngbya sp. 15MV]